MRTCRVCSHGDTRTYLGGDEDFVALLGLAEEFADELFVVTAAVCSIVRAARRRKESTHRCWRCESADQRTASGSVTRLGAPVPERAATVDGVLKDFARLDVVRGAVCARMSESWREQAIIATNRTARGVRAAFRRANQHAQRSFPWPRTLLTLGRWDDGDNEVTHQGRGPARQRRGVWRA
jgi:hypothetical protein